MILFVSAKGTRMIVICCYTKGYNSYNNYSASSLMIMIGEEESQPTASHTWYIADSYICGDTPEIGTREPCTDRANVIGVAGAAMAAPLFSARMILTALLIFTIIICSNGVGGREAQHV